MSKTDLHARADAFLKQPIDPKVARAEIARVRTWLDASDEELLGELDHSVHSSKKYAELGPAAREASRAMAYSGRPTPDQHKNAAALHTAAATKATPALAAAHKTMANYHGGINAPLSASERHFGRSNTVPSFDDAYKKAAKQAAYEASDKANDPKSHKAAAAAHKEASAAIDANGGRSREALEHRQQAKVHFAAAKAK